MSNKIKRLQQFNYFSEDERRATYKNWVFNDDSSCNANKMTEAGFIYLGSSREPDLVSCFFCNKPLDGWEASDDPWKEHIRHASYCEFAKTQKAQANWTLIQFLELRQKYEENLIKTQYAAIKKDGKKYFNELRALVVDSFGN